MWLAIGGGVDGGERGGARARGQRAGGQTRTTLGAGAGAGGPIGTGATPGSGIRDAEGDRTAAGRSHPGEVDARGGGRGDTIDVRGPNGRRETVRLIGIDAPERGRCGFRAATETLARVLRAGEIELIPGAEDERDRYQRVLRYVEVGARDAGRVLIEHGLAIARYDSRDGYGAHPREDDYGAADRASENVTCEELPPPPAADPPAPAPRGEEPQDAPFENCDQARDAGAAPVQRGEAGYGGHLDGDDDGIACE